MSGPVTEAVDDSRLTDLERLTILRLHQRIRMNDSRLTDLDRLTILRLHERICMSDDDSRLTDLDRLICDFGPSIAVDGHRPIHCGRRHISSFII